MEMVVLLFSAFVRKRSFDFQQGGNTMINDEVAKYSNCQDFKYSNHQVNHHFQAIK
jgi:hypothetical protein